MRRLLMASLGFTFLLAATLPVQAQIRGRVNRPVPSHAGRGKATINLNGKRVATAPGLCRGHFMGHNLQTHGIQFMPWLPKSRAWHLWRGWDDVCEWAREV